MGLKALFKPREGTRAAHMANNPKAITVAVMYVTIAFLRTATGFRMAGRQPTFAVDDLRQLFCDLVVQGAAGTRLRLLVL
jgi:hypothetical protein